MSFMRLLNKARYNKVENNIDEEYEVDIFNVLINDYTKKEKEYIDNIVEISKSIFDVSESKYNLQTYESLLLDFISKEECINFAKNRIRNECKDDNLLNYLLNDEIFIDYYSDYLQNFKIKVKALRKINTFIIEKMKEENMNNEDILQINNYFTSKYDNDLISCYKVIEDYITKIKDSGVIDFNSYFSNYNFT